LTQLLLSSPDGHGAIAFRSKLQPVVTDPPQEQVAGSVNPLTKLTSKSALGMPNQSTKLASISVLSVVMGKLASLIAMLPIHPGCTANVAEAPGAIVPGTSGAPALVGVPSVSSWAVEMAAVCKFKIVKVRSLGLAKSSDAGGVETIGGTVGVGATGVSVDEGMVTIGTLSELGARFIPRAAAWSTGTELLAAGVVVVLEELLVDTWMKTASKLVVDVVDVVVGDTGDPS